MAGCKVLLPDDERRLRELYRRSTSHRRGTFHVLLDGNDVASIEGKQAIEVPDRARSSHAANQVRSVQQPKTPLRHGRRKDRQLPLQRPPELAPLRRDHRQARPGTQAQARVNQPKATTTSPTPACWAARACSGNPDRKFIDPLQQRSVEEAGASCGPAAAAGGRLPMRGLLVRSACRVLGNLLRSIGGVAATRTMSAWVQLPAPWQVRVPVSVGLVFWVRSCQRCQPWPRVSFRAPNGRAGGGQPWRMAMRIPSSPAAGGRSLADQRAA